MELACIDYLKLERSKGGIENIWWSQTILADMHKTFWPEIKVPTQQLKYFMKISLFIVDFQPFFTATKEPISNLKSSGNYARLQE